MYQHWKKLQDIKIQRKISSGDVMTFGLAFCSNLFYWNFWNVIVVMTHEGFLILWEMYKYVVFPCLCDSAHLETLFLISEYPNPSYSSRSSSDVLCDFAPAGIDLFSLYVHVTVSMTPVAVTTFCLMLGFLRAGEFSY